MPDSRLRSGLSAEAVMALPNVVRVISTPRRAAMTGTTTRIWISAPTMRRPSSSAMPGIQRVSFVIEPPTSSQIRPIATG